MMNLMMIWKSKDTNNKEDIMNVRNEIQEMREKIRMLEMKAGDFDLI